MSSFDAKISWYSDLQIVWIAKVMDFDDLSHKPTEENSTGFLLRDQQMCHVSFDGQSCMSGVSHEFVPS